MVKKLFSRLSVLLWVVLICAGGVLMVFRIHARLEAAAANTAALEAEKEPAVPVDVERIKRRDWEIWRSYYGQAKAGRSQSVSTYVKEIVQEVHVKIGDRVKAGQVLLTLSSQDQRAQEAALRSSYEDSVREYKRLSELQKSGGVSQAQVEQAHSRMKGEQARLQASRSTLSRTQLKASIDGIIASRAIEPGEVASENKPLLTIIDLKDLEAEIMVSRRDIMSLTPETPVEVVSDGASSMGTIRRISPEAAPGSGLYAVVVGLNGLEVLPGTHLEARFLVEKQKDLVVIPSDVVQRREDRATVYVVEDGRAKLREIVAGEGQNGAVAVLEGLDEGDLLVIRGRNMLSDGALVKIADDGPTGDKPLDGTGDGVEKQS